MTSTGTGLLIPQGAVLDRDLSTIYPVDPQAPEQIQEYVSHSWYDYTVGKHVPLHPYDGETCPNYTGPSAADGGYSNEEFDVDGNLTISENAELVAAYFRLTPSSGGEI